MIKTFKAAGTLALAVLALTGNAAFAAPAQLALLQATVSAAPVYEVRDAAGLQQPEKALTSPTWTLAAGEPVRADRRPPDRLVELYTGTPSGPVLLCRVVLRYYPGRTGWIAHFQLIEDPALTKVDGRWQALQLAPGLPALLVQHGGTLTNAEGFFPRLEFGLTTGPLALVGWQVR